MTIEYSLSDTLERLYHNQLALEAALMELTLSAEKRGLGDVGCGRKCARSIVDNRRQCRPH